MTTPSEKASAAAGKVAGHRITRFRDLAVDLNAAGPDSSVPGAASQVSRFALLTESSRGHGRFLNYCDDVAGVERAAGEGIREGWEPVCFYDLDELAGNVPEPSEGDVVNVSDPSARQFVGAFARDGVEVIDVDTKDGRRVLGFANGRWAFADECEVVRTGYPDPRQPVKYELAQVRIVVVFNTQPTEA